MKLAFVTGPYRSKTIYGIKQNIESAEKVALELWKMGYAVICPHKNTALFDGSVPDDVVIGGDLVILDRCDVIVMIPGWKNSEGAKGEHEKAKQLGLTIIYEEE